MRTTIEISTEHRAKLLELAAKRGEKGFSALVREALERYLDEQTRRESRVEAALGVLGGWSDIEAAQVRESVRSLRGTWR